MKKYLKNMWISYIIALTIPYMLFIVEPIGMYANNINDFWFDLGIIIEPNIIFSLQLFLVISLLFNIVYFINKKVLYVFNIVVFTCFFYFYIQGNYLVGNLPVLDGERITWSKYTNDMIISGVVIGVVIIASIIGSIKFKLTKMVKICGFVTLAIFAMLSTSLISTLATTDALKVKNRNFIAASTTKNIEKFSTEDNFIIFLLDATDQRVFSEVLKGNKEAQTLLKDFTYFRDTMSVHPYTRESVPLILTGEVYENQEKYNKFLVNAYKNSELFNNLYDRDYEVNVYFHEFYFNDQDASKIANVVNTSKDGNLKLDYNKFFNQEFKYDLFRYLPFFLKEKTGIHKLNFNKTKAKSEKYTLYEPNTLDFYKNFKKQGFTSVDDQKVFKFIYTYGSHVPHQFNKDLVKDEKATYKNGVEGCLTLIEKYINYLKENDVYDNTKIVIMADHGYNGSNSKGSYEHGRQNPIFLVKGKNEHHDEITYSTKPISYIDLQDAFEDLMDNKKSNELFSNIKDDRIRRHLVYQYKEENHMVEWETKGKAWETNKMYKTGKEFNR